MMTVKTKASAGFTYVYIQDDTTGHVYRERYIRPPGMIGRLLGRTYAGKVSAAVEKLNREIGRATVKRTSLSDALEQFCIEEH
jgi:hypothetical protein